MVHGTVRSNTIKAQILLTIVYSILITMRKLSPVISKPLLIKQIIWEKEITEKGIESITCQVSQPLIFVTLFFFVLDTAISRNVVGKKICARRSRKVIWDMINTLFLTLKLSKLLLLLSFSTRRNKSMASRAILSNFFEKQ